MHRSSGAPLAFGRRHAPGLPIASRKELKMRRIHAILKTAAVPIGVAFAALSILAFAGSAYAQKVTPGQVLQVVADIQNELALMHKANFSTAKVDKGAPALTPRRPRHVMRKAEEVMQKVQTLRWINNLKANSVPPLPVRAITPGDVLKLSKIILADVRELGAKFGIVNSPKPAPSPGKKSPTDVYALLVEVSEQLDGLGIPGTLPNDVQRTAVTIISEIETIRARIGLTETIAVKSGSKGMKPADAYGKGWELLMVLNNTAATEKYEIPGGVVMPNRRTSGISPAAVLDLLNNALAEVAAIKVKVGVTTATKLAPVQSGKTPSNIFDAVDTAIVMIESLNQAPGP